MSREIILGIDCQVLYMPTSKRVYSPANLVKPYNNIDYSSTTRYVNGDWVALTPVKDVTLNLTCSTADVTMRSSNGWRQMVPAIKEASVDFSMLWCPDNDTVHGDAFRDILQQFVDQCPVAFMFLDGMIDVANLTANGWMPTEGRCGQYGDISGLKADFAVTKFTRNESLEEGLMADITLEPTVGLIYPEWVVMGFDADATPSGPAVY